MIGITIDAPKFTEFNSEDFILFNCEEWTIEEKTKYEELNKRLNFLQTDNVRQSIIRTNDFPQDNTIYKASKIGRNDQCPCGSGKKYKWCCSQ